MIASTTHLARHARADLRERIRQETERRLFAAGVICGRCGATFRTYEDSCPVDYGAGCPGFREIVRMRTTVEKELGW